MIRVKHGFHGQRMIILPLSVYMSIEGNNLMNDLYIHSLGYFPNAKNHFIKRGSGCPENIVIYCNDGKGWFETEGKRVELAKGQAVILKSDTPHSYGAHVVDPWSIYWFHFNGSKIQLFSDSFNKLLDLRNKRAEEIIGVFDNIYNCLDSSFDHNSLIFANMGFGYFLTQVLFGGNTLNNISYATSLVNLASHYMYENVTKKLTLGEIAAHFGFSVSYFYRIFFKSMNCAPMEYFNQLKIQKACHLLQTTNRKINEIASELGFDDSYYFSRLFKKITGYSPSEYRMILPGTWKTNNKEE